MKQLICAMLFLAFVQVPCSIRAKFQSSFFSINFLSVHVVHPYSNIDTHTHTHTLLGRNCILFYSLTSI